MIFKTKNNEYNQQLGRDPEFTISKPFMSEVTLISEDGIKFQVRIQVVQCIGLFKNLLELHLSTNSGSPLPSLQVPNVNSLILDKIIEYLNNFTASRENSVLTKPSSINSMKVKSIINGIQNKAKNENEDDGDGDDDDEDDDSVKISSIPMEQDFDEFELNGDDENIFDFANFDEQSLNLFTPYEQNFFGSLDIPTLIEITKVILKQALSVIYFLICRLLILCIFRIYLTVAVRPSLIT